MSILEVQNLSVGFEMGSNMRSAVDDVTFSVEAAEVLAIVGESGSGKSVTAMSILGLLPENALATGQIRLSGVELLSLSPAKRRKAIANRISVIFQDPVTALNPVYSIGFQIVESVRSQHPEFGRKQAIVRAIELLGMVGIPEPEKRMSYFAHQLSGGQCQRIMIAMALAGEPDILIADEPTTALDVTVQAEVLELLRELRTRLSTAIVVITHDMGIVADIADRVIVMRSGKVVEQASVGNLFYDPQEQYTKDLLAAVPQIGIHQRDPAAQQAPTTLVLKMSEIVIEFGSKIKGQRFRAIDHVDLQIGAGDFVGLVGESGSGKSTLGRCALGAIEPVSGTIRTCGLELGSLSRTQRKELSRRTAMVFQNPTGSLDPRYTVGDSIAESLIVHEGLRGKALRTRVADLIAMVELPREWASRYPHEMSGGQRQRVSIARAIALNPELLIADEPTSALDVSVQARILDLFRELQQDLKFACLFISHDLAVIDQVCDQVVVMNRGRVVESGQTSQILNSPSEEYTKQLVAAAPIPDPNAQRARREARVLVG